MYKHMRKYMYKYMRKYVYKYMPKWNVSVGAGPSHAQASSAHSFKSADSDE